MKFKDEIQKPFRYLLKFLKWGLLGVLMGLVGGLLGAVFYHILHFVTQLRTDNNWLIFLLPVGGLATVGIYRVLKLQTNRGTNEVIESVLKK